MVLKIDPQIHENPRWNEIAGMNSGGVRRVPRMVGPGCLERAGRLALGRHGAALKGALIFAA